MIECDGMYVPGRNYQR